MLRLGQTDRDALVLRFFEGRSLNEVGMALGASEDAAKKRVNRAVEKLRAFFTQRGIVLPAAVLTAAISANSVQAAPVTLAKTVTAVASAKGAAASTSTLTLVKGTLKMMARVKIKFAFGICAMMLFATGGVVINKRDENQISFEAEGTLTYATTPDSRGSYKDTKHFIVARDGNLCKIRTITEKQERIGLGGPIGDSVDLYYEMGFDGTNIFTLGQEKFSPESRYSTNYNAAMGRVEKADSPPCMDTYRLYPVWLAYCSAPYLENLKDDKVASPLFNTRTGDFLTDPVIRMQLPAKWNLNDKSFVKSVSWFSDGTFESHSPDGKVKISCALRHGISKGTF
jgi:hypothetical protein